MKKSKTHDGTVCNCILFCTLLKTNLFIKLCCAVFFSIKIVMTVICISNILIQSYVASNHLLHQYMYLFFKGVSRVLVFESVWYVGVLHAWPGPAWRDADWLQQTDGWHVVECAPPTDTLSQVHMSFLLFCVHKCMYNVRSKKEIILV